MTKKDFAKLFKTKEELDAARAFICDRQAEACEDESTQGLADMLWHGVKPYSKLPKKDIFEILWETVIDEDMEDFEIEEFVNNQVLNPK